MCGVGLGREQAGSTADESLSLLQENVCWSDGLKVRLMDS